MTWHKLAVSILAVLFATNSIHAELILTENFSYPLSTSLEGNGEWTTPYSGTSGITITNALTFKGYYESEEGGAAALDSDCGAYQPHLPFTQVKEGELYVAFILYPYANYKTGYFLCLRGEGANNTSSFNYNARIHLSDKNELGLRVQKAAAAQYNTDYTLSPEQTYLLVLKYAIKEGKNNDEVSLYVFDEMPTSEPSEALIGPITDSGSPDIAPCNLVLRGYDADSWLSVGAIRIATTFHEAIGIPEPMQTPVVSSNTPVIKRMTGGEIHIEREGTIYNLLGQKQ